MVQPYMRSIEKNGERALVFVAGRFSHAAAKNAMLKSGVAYDARKVTHPGLRKYSPTERELATAHQALAIVPGGNDLLYARVDLVDNEQGVPSVMELELVEPDLFLTIQEGEATEHAAARVAKALVLQL